MTRHLTNEAKDVIKDVLMNTIDRFRVLHGVWVDKPPKGIVFSYERAFGALEDEVFGEPRV